MNATKSAAVAFDADAAIRALGIDPDALETPEQMEARAAAGDKARREANYWSFFNDLPAEYRETSDSVSTPAAALPALFAAKAACGSLSYPVNQDALRAAILAAPGPLYLFGDTGSGKTRAALRRAGRMILSGEIEGVRLVRFGEVAREYTRRGPDAFDAVTSRPGQLLIVDDFLNGQTIAARREPFAWDWFDLLERVATNRTPCILTANAAPEKIAAWFGGAGVDPESVVRRLGQMFRVIAF